MIICFKCSFKSSNGFKIGKYNSKDNTLVYVKESRKDLKEAGIPDAVAFTLKNQIQGTLLATDEHKKFFFGVYRLIEGDDDKFVSAVFYGEKQESILGLYQLFCKKYEEMNRKIMNCVSRKYIDMHNKDELEFQIDDEQLHKLLENAKKETIELSDIVVSPNAILAFITENTLSDYQLTLAEQFRYEKIFLCEHITPKQEKIHDYDKAYTKNKNIIPFFLFSIFYGIPTLVSLAYYFKIL